MTKCIALIPARFEASRFPGKLLADLAGKTVLQRTFEAVRDSALFDEVIVVCDDDRIENHIQTLGGKTFRSISIHESGSDRIAEAARHLEADIIVNIQGDEPFISANHLAAVLALFKNDAVQIGSLVTPIKSPERYSDPNCVKVVLDHQQRALYFSRSPIPFLRDGGIPTTAYQHIGIYGFRKETLLYFTSLPPSPLEQSEKLENLRMLENGIPVHMAVVEGSKPGIDTPEDLELARNFWDTQAKY